MQNQPLDKTVYRWIASATEAMESEGLFFGHGTDNAWDEACWMVAYVLNLPPDFSEDVQDTLLDQAQTKALNSLLARRIDTRSPLAYLTGQAWFAGLDFAVTPDVLVPRSPMAELILEGLTPWIDNQSPKRVLDVGTGSGCIALAVAYHWPNASEVVGVDISEAALIVAKGNARRLHLERKVRWLQSDVYGALESETFDVILSNPPYVPTISMPNLPAEYGFEPALGLEAGESGLDIVERLILGAGTHLNPGGILICEVGEAAQAWDEWAQQKKLEIVWLEFEYGGDGVFLVTHEALSRLSV